MYSVVYYHEQRYIVWMLHAKPLTYSSAFSLRHLQRYLQYINNTLEIKNSLQVPTSSSIYTEVLGNPLVLADDICTDTAYQSLIPNHWVFHHTQENTMPLRTKRNTSILGDLGESLT